MEKERRITSEILKKGGVLAAALGILVSSAPAVVFGALGYFTGDYIQPKQTNAK